MLEEGLTQEQEAEILHRVHLGKLDNLPGLASKIVRIFTSSTFTGSFGNLFPFSRWKSISFRY